MSARRPFRRALGGVAIAIATALAITACAGGAAPTPENSGASGGEVTWAIEGGNLSDGHMDPQISQVDSSGMVQRAVLDSLVWQKDDGTFAPWLATKWEVSPDGLAYTFTLRDDVTFSDGTVFDAAAVKTNFDRIVDPKTASKQAASMLGGENYKATTVVDPHTVRVEFKTPYAAFLQAASTANLGFWSPKVLAAAGDKTKAGGPDVNVGTGPFIMSSYKPNAEIVYTANPDYRWGPDGGGAPKIKTLKVALVPEPSVRTGMLGNGEAQVVSQLPPSALSGLDSSLQVSVNSYPGLPYSLFLNEKFGVFADKKVRQAFAVAVDIDSVVNSVFDGKLKRAWSILGPTMADYDASLDGAWPYDAKKANALLDEAGWTKRDGEGYRTKDGKRLSATWIAWTPMSDDKAAIANAVQSDLKKVGFEVKREVLEPNAYNELYVPRKFDITDWDFSNGDPDMLRNHLATDGFQNASSVSDPKVDAWVKQGAESTDPAKRAEAYKNLQQWNLDAAAIVPVYVPALITVQSPKLKGLTFDPFGRPLFATASLG